MQGMIRWQATHTGAGPTGGAALSAAAGDPMQLQVRAALLPLVHSRAVAGAFRIVLLLIVFLFILLCLGRALVRVLRRPGLLLLPCTQCASAH